MDGVPGGLFTVAVIVGVPGQLLPVTEVEFNFKPVGKVSLNAIPLSVAVVLAAALVEAEDAARDEVAVSVEDEAHSLPRECFSFSNPPVRKTLLVAVLDGLRLRRFVLLFSSLAFLEF